MEDVFPCFSMFFLLHQIAQELVNAGNALAPTEVADSLSAAPSVWCLFHCSNLVDLVELMDRR